MSERRDTFRSQSSVRKKKVKLIVKTLLGRRHLKRNGDGGELKGALAVATKHCRRMQIFTFFLGGSNSAGNGDGERGAGNAGTDAGIKYTKPCKKKVKLLMQAPPTDPRTMPAIRMKAQVPCGKKKKDLSWKVQKLGSKIFSKKSKNLADFYFVKKKRVLPFVFLSVFNDEECRAGAWNMGLGQNQVKFC